MATTTIFESSKSPSCPQFGLGQAHYSATSAPDPALHSSHGFGKSHYPATSTRNPEPQGISPKPSSGSLGPEPEHYRLMKKGEWLQFCRGIGILKDEESEEVIRTTSRLWPPSGFKDGLYNDVLYEKTKFSYFYHALSTIVWLLLLLQLALSAILTALGATSKENGVPITAIAAINTGVSGILALMHNSGLPDRYRSDRNEFYRIEEHLKSIVDSGLVPVSHSVNDALAECFEMFATALQTVENNAPSTYALAIGPRPLASAAPLRSLRKRESKK